MPPLASVVRSVRVQTYLKVDNNTPLALFHKKFLGKSMKDEEVEWQKIQIQIGGQPKDEGQNKYEAIDQGKGSKGKVMDESSDEVMNEGGGKPDEDEGEATNEDDDIIPGCYVLDISIDDMPTSLWIRADYIRIFDFFQAHYEEFTKPKPRGKTPSAVLTGQPGTGKSYWIYYAARRLLATTRPFIWLYKAKYYLFVDDGVYKLPLDWEHDDFSCIVCTLVDSDHSRDDGVPDILVPHGTRLYVMYVTSPAESRWSRLHKTTRSMVVIMNPWSRKEMQRAARLAPLKEITETHVNEIFDQLGPVAHLCINWTSDQLAEYRNELYQTISKITTDDIKKLTNEVSGLTMDAVSRKIFLLSRQQRDDVLSQPVVVPITDSIKSKLSNQLWKLQRAEQI